MKRKKLGFVKRGILLGSGALLLIIIIVLAAYPYERAIELALARMSEENGVRIAPAQTNFRFPNRIRFDGLRIVPSQRPYHLLETEFTKLSTEIGLRALLIGRLRVRFSGEIDSGDPEEGNYALSGIVSVRKGEKKGSGGSPPRGRAVRLQNVRLTGSEVNFTIDGHVTFVGEMFNPVLELRFFVERLDRTDSANYAIDNLLKFVRGGVQEGAELPVAFTVSGPFSRLTLSREDGGEG